MKRFLVLAVLLVSFHFAVTSILGAANRPPQKGETLPVINLPIPKSPAEKSYLELSGEGSFQIPRIKARVVIVQIFSMYCPHCQKDAPGVNEFYELIQKDSNLKGKIKIIGIGVGNTPLEVNIFKKTYAIPFPLFSDQEFTVHRALGEVRTPYFMVVKINDDGSHRIVHAQLGEYPGPKRFLEIVLESSGLR